MLEVADHVLDHGVLAVVGLQLEGVVLPATLGHRLGLPELLRQHVHLGKVAGAANPVSLAIGSNGSRSPA